MLLAWNGAWEEHAERIVKHSYFVSVLHILSQKLLIRCAAKEDPEFYGGGVWRSQSCFEIHLTKNLYFSNTKCEKVIIFSN